MNSIFQKARRLNELQVVLLAGLLGLAGHVSAQAPPANAGSASLLSNAAGYTAVSIQPEPRNELGAATPMSNTVFKPAGDGPFPAVVLLHSCGGIAPAHIRTHAKEMLQAGFAVLVLDSHGPRGFDTCRQKLIPFAVGAMDAYAGLQHLARQPFVHQQRIYFAGYSYGGSVAALLASPQSAAVFASPLRFKASAAHYANCVRPSGARLVLPDTDRPLLMLMGQADTESPPNSCFPLLADMQTAGGPVSWHVYPGLTHGWDRVDGSANGYVYNEAGSTDATRRMLAFFDASR